MITLDKLQELLNTCTMKIKQASNIFEALSSEVRLGLFRLLVKYAPNGLVAGEIAKILAVTNTNLSFHLKELLHTGLITVEKEGRFLRYRANIPLMLETIGFLSSECCSERSRKSSNSRSTSVMPSKVLPDCGCTEMTEK